MPSSRTAGRGGGLAAGAAAATVAGAAGALFFVRRIVEAVGDVVPGLVPTVFRLPAARFGVAIIENQLHETARIVAVPAAAMEREEMKLLEQARRLMPAPISTGDDLVLLPLGGAGEIGMNFNAYGFGPPDERKWIVVDCGVLFGRETETPGV